jgi:hypothetical protein
LRATVERALAPAGVHRVVINGYANSHAEYLTTFEEYQHQQYEGSSTLFGQWELGGFQTEYQKLATEMAQGKYSSDASIARHHDFVLDPETQARAVRQSQHPRANPFSRFIGVR